MNQEDHIARMLADALNGKEEVIGTELDPYIRMANALRNNAKSAEAERMPETVKERQAEKLRQWSAVLKSGQQKSESIKEPEKRKKAHRAWWPVWIGGLGTAMAAVIFLAGWPKMDQQMNGARRAPEGLRMESAGGGLAVPESDEALCTAEPERMEESGINRHTEIRLDCRVPLAIEDLQSHLQLKNIRSGKTQEILSEQRVDGGFLLTPTENLDPGSVYRLELKTEVERTDGKKYEKILRWAWQTEGEWKADLAEWPDADDRQTAVLRDPVLLKAEAAEEESNELGLFLVFPRNLRAGDQPIMKFGAMNADAKEVEYEIHAPGLGMNHQELKALNATPVALAIMPPIGNHEIAIRARAGDKEAEIRRVLRIAPAEADDAQWKIWPLKTGSSFPDLGRQEPHRIFLAEEERAKWQMQWEQVGSDSGPDLCAYLGRKVAQEEARLEKEQDAGMRETALLQKKTGGFSWEPHLSADVFASAWAAILHPEDLDQEKLAAVLEGYALSETSFVRRAAAHAGLAALGHPSLQSLYRLAEDRDLLGSEGLVWVDRGLWAAGADPEREKLRQTEKKENAEAVDPADEKERMCQAVLEMRQRFSERERISVSIQYATGTESIALEIPSGEGVWTEWTEKEAAALKILNASGSVAGVFKLADPAEKADLFPGTVTRSYWSDQTETQSVTDGEDVTVAIKLAWEGKRPDGCLKITDYLPAGMRMRERIAENPEGMETEGYAYAVTENEIQFVVCGTEPAWKRLYPAEIVAPGRYTAPPPKICLMQSPRHCWRGDRTEVDIGQ